MYHTMNIYYFWLVSVCILIVKSEIDASTQITVKNTDSSIYFGEQICISAHYIVNVVVKGNNRDIQLYDSKGKFIKSRDVRKETTSRLLISKDVLKGKIVFMRSYFEDNEFIVFDEFDTLVKEMNLKTEFSEKYLFSSAGFFDYDRYYNQGSNKLGKNFHVFIYERIDFSLVQKIDVRKEANLSWLEALPGNPLTGKFLPDSGHGKQLIIPCGTNVNRTNSFLMFEEQTGKFNYQTRIFTKESESIGMSITSIKKGRVGTSRQSYIALNKQILSTDYSGKFFIYEIVQNEESYFAELVYSRSSIPKGYAHTIYSGVDVDGNFREDLLVVINLNAEFLHIYYQKVSGFRDTEFQAFTLSMLNIPKEALNVQLMTVLTTNSDLQHQFKFAISGKNEFYIYDNKFQPVHEINTEMKSVVVYPDDRICKMNDLDVSCTKATSCVTVFNSDKDYNVKFTARINADETIPISREDYRSYMLSFGNAHTTVHKDIHLVKGGEFCVNMDIYLNPYHLTTNVGVTFSIVTPIGNFSVASNSVNYLKINNKLNIPRLKAESELILQITVKKYNPALSTQGTVHFDFKAIYCIYDVKIQFKKALPIVSCSMIPGNILSLEADMYTIDIKTIFPSKNMTFIYTLICTFERIPNEISRYNITATYIKTNKLLNTEEKDNLVININLLKEVWTPETAEPITKPRIITPEHDRRSTTINGTVIVGKRKNKAVSVIVPLLIIIIIIFTCLLIYYFFKRGKTIKYDVMKVFHRQTAPNIDF